MFCERILGVGFDDVKRIGFKIRIGDHHRVSHPLQFPSA